MSELTYGPARHDKFLPKELRTVHRRNLGGASLVDAVSFIHFMSLWFSCGSSLQGGCKYGGK